MYALRSSSQQLQEFADTTIRVVLTRSERPDGLLESLGTSAAMDGQWQFAVQYFDQALQVDLTRSPVILNNLAIALIRSTTEDRYTEALKLIDEARLSIPESLELLATRGEILMALKNWKAAEADLKAVLKASPSHPDAARLLPILQQQKNQ
jgi:uncharacterized protein HemY